MNYKSQNVKVIKIIHQLCGLGMKLQAFPTAVPAKDVASSDAFTFGQGGSPIMQLDRGCE